MWTACLCPQPCRNRASPSCPRGWPQDAAPEPHLRHHPALFLPRLCSLLSSSRIHVPGPRRWKANRPRTRAPVYIRSRNSHPPVPSAPLPPHPCFSGSSLFPPLFSRPFPPSLPFLPRCSSCLWLIHTLIQSSAQQTELSVCLRQPRERERERERQRDRETERQRDRERERER